MKKILTILLTAVFVSLALDASAQQVVKQRIGTYKESGNVVVSEATTTLVVDLTVECEEFEAGVYARYAQKYFGKRASLVSRMSYALVGGDVAVLDAPSYYAAPANIMTESVVTAGDKVMVDRLAADELTQEEAAKRAAERILELRAARQDILLGEYGDGVYGAGLEAALREIERLEGEYLKLFYGTRTVTTTTHRYIMPVSADMPNNVIARFNSEEGLLAKDNVAGDIVMVSVTPSEMSYPASNPKGTVAYRYANNATVVVSYAQKVLARRVLPIFEFGETVYFVMPK
ncbi:MAG: DUF4831 family protein [Alistipes sp.]|nr:DUF4831 family protein [Alistipes sp.]